MLVDPDAPGVTYLDGGGRPHDPTAAPVTPPAGAVVVPPESGLAALGLADTGPRDGDGS
jgi:hypothetical protein